MSAPDDTPPEHHNAGGTEDWTRLWWPAAMIVGVLASVAIIWGCCREL